MTEINRSVVVVKPKQPYLDWVQSLDDEGTNVTLADLQQDCTAFLVPELLDEEHQEEILAQYHDVLFEYELASWIEDDALWPPKRNLTMFKEWFETEFSSLVVDVVGDPLRTVEEDD